MRKARYPHETNAKGSDGEEPRRGQKVIKQFQSKMLNIPAKPNGWCGKSSASDFRAYLDQSFVRVTFDSDPVTQNSCHRTVVC